MNLIHFLLIFIFVCYILRSVKNILYHLFWWELKEYRFDRMYIHLSQTSQGQLWIFNPLSIIKWIIFIIFLFSIKYSELLFFANLLSIITYMAEGSKILKDWNQIWMKPSFNKRSLIIFISVLISNSLIFLWGIKQRPNLIFFYIILIDKLNALIIFILMIFTNLIFKYYKSLKISKAMQKLTQYERLKIIGITGSYGKTTTKDFLGQILSAKFKIIKTDKSKNSDIAVAEKILDSNLAGVDYFVCEMGAYKIGEIKSICDMLKGKINIAIITGINEQHQALFGSIQNTLKAKFELVEALSRNGLVIFNQKSKHIDALTKMTSRLQLKAQKIKPENFKINGPIKNESYYAECLALAIAAAKFLGMSDHEISIQFDKIKLPEKNMNRIQANNILLIDDTFNSNPTGVYAALDLLNKQKGTKFFVFQPIIELGVYACKIHKKIGHLSASVCDRIILTNRNYSKCFINGASEVSGGFKKISFKREIPTDLTGTILFEGKESAGLLTKYNRIFK